MVMPVKMKRGRYGKHLPIKFRNDLKKIIAAEEITIQVLADRIGISRSQLDHPLRTGKCSVESFQKISAFLESAK